MSTILVIGANGTVGSALVPLLTARGHRVVAATSRQPAGSHQVQVDLATGHGLSTAFTGIDAAFLMSPPGHTNQDVLLGRAIDAARAQGVGKVVLMTAMGANADPNGPMRKAELHLAASGMAFNIIRPNWFMQNFHTFWLHGIVHHGAILLPVGTAKGSFIDARDIAAVAGELLSSSRHDGQEFDLTGSEALDHHEVAKILTQVAGRTISYQEITPEAMLQGLLGAGLPRPYAEFLIVILGYFKAGYAERTTDAVAQITGTAPRRFAAYAEDHRAAWA